MGREGTHLILGLVIAGFLGGQALAVGALHQGGGPASASAQAAASSAPRSAASTAAGTGVTPVADDGPTTGPAATARPSIKDGDRKALIIGINHTPGAGVLRGAVGDAEAIRDALVTFGYEPSDVVVLLEGEATKGRILSEIRSLAARTPAHGQAVFAFAGHTRRKNGENQLRAADGGTISAGALATHLREVRAPMWVALPTCYAAGYRVPGISGPNRVATFASAPDQLAYESTAFRRSYLIEYMVVRGMLSGKAPATVEGAFAFAHTTLQRTRPDRVPLIQDDYAGDFVLGSARYTPKALPDGEPRDLRFDESAPPPQEDTEPPPATPAPQNKGLHTCGAVKFKCRTG
jgi:hypothetical protein